MRLRNISGRISRFGGKLASGSERALGKVEKGVKSADRAVMKGLVEVEKAADSKVVKGVQQGLGISGRLLASTGVPQLQAAGGALLAGQQGLKQARKAVGPAVDVVRDKAEYVRKGKKTLTGAVPRESEVTGDRNMLERAKSAKEGTGVNYMS